MIFIFKSPYAFSALAIASSRDFTFSDCASSDESMYRNSESYVKFRLWYSASLSASFKKKASRGVSRTNLYAYLKAKMYRGFKYEALGSIR